MAHGSSGGTTAAVSGRSVLAATLMLVAGAYQVLEGIVAIVRGGFFIVTPNYLYAMSLRSWGWIHVIIGGLAVLTALGLYTGAFVARVVGIGLAVASAVANFFFLPYYPIWSLLIIALNAVVIWAISTGGSRVDSSGPGRYASAYPDRGAGYGGDRWPQPNQPGAGRDRNERRGPPDRTEPARTEEERASPDSVRTGARSSADD